MNSDICFKELIELMEKGEAPEYINHKGIIYKYILKDCDKETRIKDIKKYGIWNNGGYVSDNIDFLLDNIEESNFKSKITIIDKNLIEDLEKELNNNKMIKTNSIDYEIKAMKMLIDEMKETIENQKETIEQLENIRKEAIEYIEGWQSFPHTNCTTHNELKNLLNILNKGSDK